MFDPILLKVSSVLVGSAFGATLMTNIGYQKAARLLSLLAVVIVGWHLFHLITQCWLELLHLMQMVGL